MIAPSLHDKNDLHGSKIETKKVGWHKVKTTNIQQTLANVRKKLASPCYKSTATTMYKNNLLL